MGFIHKVNMEMVLLASLPLINKNNIMFQQRFIESHREARKTESTYSELPRAREEQKSFPIVALEQDHHAKAMGFCPYIYIHTYIHNIYRLQ